MADKNMQKGSMGIIVAIFAVILIGGGLFYYNKTTPKLEQKIGGHEMAGGGAKMNNGMQGEGHGAMTMKAGTYEAYAPEKIAKAETGKVVLFFHASWCVTCRAIDNDIRAHLDAIPENVTILELDYDKSDALKQKYKITTQHTLVQVDARGEQIKQWKGTMSLADLIAQIQ